MRHIRYRQLVFCFEMGAPSHNPHQSSECDQHILNSPLNDNIIFKTHIAAGGLFLPGGQPLMSSTVSTDRNEAIKLLFFAIYITVL